MRGLLLLLVALLLALTSLTKAQAQGQPSQIESLTVSLLPQYDDPRLLVIYNATLDAPGEVLLGAPSGVELHAAAYRDEAGTLRDAEAGFRAESDGRFIRVDAPTREVQVELYYDVIPRQPQRSVTFTLPRQRYDVENLTWTATFPTSSSDAGAEPPMTPLGLNHFGMLEWQREAGPLPAGETAAQTISWLRESDAPSFEVPGAEAAPAPEPPSRSWLPYTGAFLAFLVGVLLVANGIHRQRRAA
ncbi:MAG TPA: hypothetical protein VF707_15520 [Ardenticatenaceae bacterium]|jgi:hypothetical protein